jgi:DNA helicase HerA-like ATPase
VCEEERQNGRGRYPFVLYEEAHFYAAPEEILNLITRGRHLGITTFFVTNSPGELPEVVFRQLDNLIVTGLSHSSDLRTIAKCSLSDEDTLHSLAVGLRPTEALVVGRVTRGFPLVVEVDALPAGWPPTGVTRSFWDDGSAA